MRIRRLAVCAMAFALAGFGQQAGEDWRQSMLKTFLSNCQLTKATADKSSIVTAGTVVVLKKDNLVLYSTANRIPPGNSYVNGAIKAGFMSSAYLKSGNARAFVAGEKLWLTKASIEPKGDGVVLEFLSDPFDDARYWGTLKFNFAKGSPPPAPEEFEKTLEQVVGVDASSDSKTAQAPARPSGGQAAQVAAPVETPASIPPPPPPPDQPPPQPPTVAVGMTKDQVIAIMGQPKKVGNISAVKQIYLYPDFKITLTSGKVTNIE